MKVYIDLSDEGISLVKGNGFRIKMYSKQDAQDMVGILKTLIDPEEHRDKCFWDAKLSDMLCHKHGGPIGDCPGEPDVTLAHGLMTIKAALEEKL